MCHEDEHYFPWAGSSYDTEVPEGMSCMCGLMKAHYEKCPECGEWHLKPVPNQVEDEHY